MKIMILLGGQGTLDSHLYDLLQTDPEGTSPLSQASKLVNFDPVHQISKPSAPKFSQVLIGLYQIAVFSYLKKALSSNEIELAGYSLGEMVAFLISIEADLPTALKAIQYRTEIMSTLLNKQDPYDLVAVSGDFDIEQIEPQCEKNHCEVAIINGRGRFIIGGKVTNLKKLLSESDQIIDHSTFLSIFEPSHTSFYAPISEKLTEYLQNQFSAASLAYPIISPVRECKIEDAKEEMALLGKELSTQLHWHRVCELIPENGYDLIIDLGPGSSMTSILKASGASLEDCKILTVSEFKTLSGLKDYICKMT